MTNDDLSKIAIDLYKQANNGRFLLSRFREEYTRLIIFSRLIRRYRETGEMSARLAVNYSVILYNNFGNNFTPFFFLYSEDKETDEAIMTFLKFLSRIPEDLPTYQLPGRSIELSKLKDDQNVLKLLNQEFGNV